MQVWPNDGETGWGTKLRNGLIALENLINGKAEANHSHAYAPAGHIHTEYASTTHEHDEYANQTVVTAALALKAEKAHTHRIDDITNMSLLAYDLTGKTPLLGLMSGIDSVHPGVTFFCQLNTTERGVPLQYELSYSFSNGALSSGMTIDSGYPMITIPKPAHNDPVWGENGQCTLTATCKAINIYNRTESNSSPQLAHTISSISIINAAEIAERLCESPASLTILAREFAKIPAFVTAIQNVLTPASSE